MTDIVTYCDVNTCEDCPRYGDDCDGDKRVEHTDLISRADAIKAVEQEYMIDRGYMVDDYTYGFNQAIHYVSDIILPDLPSAETHEIRTETHACVKETHDVVRCKDCKWYKKIVEKSKSGLCHYDLVARCLHDEDYCSHGERREP